MDSLTHTSRHSKLVEDIRCKIDRLVDAIHRITTTKRQMQEGVTEVKSEIHSSVSSQLSAIRTREAWLLDQVDQQCQVKVDALTTQGDTLQQSLGHLRGLLQVSTSQPDDVYDRSDDVDSQIGEVLESTKDKDLQSVTTLGLQFKVDNATLLRAIHNYGCVDPNGMPFDAFVHPDWTSVSLPRAVEEYDDPSHHVLYKTVAEVRQTQTDDNSIQVTVPRLHTVAGDWLCIPSSPEPCQQPTEHAAFSWNIPDSLSHLSDSASSGSLQRWLLDIQNEADVDDNDGGFELIGCDQPAESNVSSQKQAELHLPDAMTVFQEVIKSPSSSWLQNTTLDKTNTDVHSSLFEDNPREANPNGEADPIPATESMADWIQVASTSRRPVSNVCRSCEVSSSDMRSVRRQEVMVMHDTTVDKWPLDRPLCNPSADLLYFRHFAVVLDSPSSDWLQHGYVSSLATVSTPACQHELLKLQISDWLMLQKNCMKEIPAQS
ncbi:hypothetical protein LSAT2_018342 [Lamellibrachia satsuma]|nr:hypothetical protein LSAT2_018342 [Lamellibrachia satsuma]